ncbi:MAG: tripartite tricarboxylate transporter substrate binding protein [Proteobacteria bacterium]|nr:tripartite tricarboxylate transporter substrate binding protein [Pseudomonadota bacterium]
MTGSSDFRGRDRMPTLNRVAISRRHFNKMAVALAGGLVAPTVGQAAESALPSQITFVVPFAAGGGADQLGREFAKQVQDKLPGTVVVIENKGGANGAIAAQFVARRAPDGRTFLLGTSSTQALGPLLENVAFDPIKQFSPCAGLAESSSALAVSATSKWQSLDEFLAAARKSTTTFGTFGARSSAHLYGLILASATNAKLEHVPYKGSSNAIIDLLGGHIDSVVLTTGALDSMAKAGKVRILAVTGKKRLSYLPNVPTFKESGVAGLEFNGWFGLFGPKGVPRPMLDQLANVAQSLNANRQFTEHLAALGYDWAGTGPDELGEELQETIKIYKTTIASLPAGLLPK